jgi:hypothetical protein
MTLPTTYFYPGTVLIWLVEIDPTQPGTSIWDGSNLVVGSSPNSGGPRMGAPLLMQLFVEHDGVQIVECQRGIGRQAAAFAVTTATPTFPIPAGPGAFPAQSRGVPIMVGEPIVLKAPGAGATVNVRVCGIVVAVN